MRPGPTAPAGLATLPILLLLLMVSLLTAAWTQRSVLNEIRSASLQLKHGIAFEVAEAGLAWTQALLSSGHGIGDDCLPASAGGAQTFRDRFLQFVAGAEEDGVDVTLRERGAASGEAVLICARTEGGWRCACPATGAPTLGVGPAAATDAPTFSVRLHDGAAAGTLRISVTGCSHAARPCIGGAAERADAHVNMRQTLALLPTLGMPPAATLTVRQDVTAPAAAAISVHNRDAASGGLALHAGGSIDAPALRSTSVAGAAAFAERIGGDAALAALSPGQLFQRHFGPSIGEWQRQPGVQPLSCQPAEDCGARLLERISTEVDVARIAVDTDLYLRGPLALGSPSRPVVLVVDGDLRLEGSIVIHGLVHARNLHWSDAPADGSARLHGAAIVAGSFSTDGAPAFSYDAALMERLRTRSGSWVRLPGSWRDDE